MEGWIFIEREDQKWYLSLAVEDPSKGTIKQGLVMLRFLIDNGTINPEMKPCMEIINSSILWIVDFALEPKYLSSGAVWGSITHGVHKEEIKITLREQVLTEAGMFSSFVLSYMLEDKESKFWIVKDKPLPVKARPFDSDGKLQFEFELVNN